MKSLVTISRRAKILVLPCLACVFSVTANSSDFTGEVVRIIDGDTVVLLSADKKQARVRLAESDAPEKAQAFGEKSRQALAAMAYRQQVKVIDIGQDRYGRTIGVLLLGEKNLNASMVEQGMAWVYRQYSTNANLLSLENEARTERIGIWLDTNPIPPWQFRKNKKELSQ